MKKKLEYTEALNEAKQLCSRQEKCSRDIMQKLKEWGISGDESEKIIEILENEKFINDQRYAQFYTRDKFKFNKWGKHKIGYMLKQLGISQTDIDTAFETINEEDYYEVLMHELQKKLKQLSAEADPYKLKSKLINFAQSHGFENDIIFKAIDELLNQSLDE